VAGRARTVSVVIPTYGKSALLSRTLAALADQTYPADATEVIVVDDCSGDGTSRLLKDVSAPWRLVSLVHDENRGRAAARNTGVRAADGQIIVFLDDDMRAVPSLLSDHVRCHELHANSAVIGNALTAPELGPSGVFRYLDSRGVHKLAPGSRVPARYFSTNNSSVPRDALLSAGLFDEAFRSYGFEDTEIAFRLEDAAGLAFLYCAEAIAYHTHSHTLHELLLKREEAGRSSLGHLLAKHPDRARELSVEALLPLARGDSPVLRLRKRASRVLLATPFETLAASLAGARWLGPLAHPLIDYLILAAYRKGLAQAARSESL